MSSSSFSSALTPVLRCETPLNRSESWVMAHFTKPLNLSVERQQEQKEETLLPVHEVPLPEPSSQPLDNYSDEEEESL